MIAHEHLMNMLTRLHLTAIRDQLDSLLDEAARQELTLRETLAFLCQREIARKDERRIQMGTRIAHFPCIATLAGFDYAPSPAWMNGRSANWRPAAGWPTARICCSWGHPVSARPTWPSPLGARPS